MSNVTDPRVHFGRHSFEPATGRLWTGGTEVRLTRKSAGVLGLLVQRAGHPVSKQDLFAAVWRDTVVSDDALTTCVQELRKALGDDAREPRYIETRHRYGYSFVAALSETSSPQRPAIAVLPFTDMTPERNQSYFCEGVAEELIDALNRVEGLRVACRSCSFRFRGAGVDVREIGRQLAVSAVVQGSVRKAGDRLRITVQLVAVANGYHEWSHRFERTLGDVFEIQDEIAQAVALTFRPEVQRPPTAETHLPAAEPRSRGFSASPRPRTRARSTGLGNMRPLPASLEVC
jgi:adenylate cyclase